MGKNEELYFRRDPARQHRKTAASGPKKKTKIVQEGKVERLSKGKGSCEQAEPWYGSRSGKFAGKLIFIMTFFSANNFIAFE